MRHHKMKWLKYFGVPAVIITLAALFQCTAVKELARMKKPQLSVQQMRMTGLSFQNVDLAFDVKIDNPNSLSISLEGFDYDFLINDNQFLKGAQETKTTIQARQASIVEVPVSLSFQDIYDTYQSLKTTDSSSYQIKMGLKFNLPIIGETRIPVSTSGYLPLLKIPTVKVESLSLKKMSLSGADLELKVRVENANALRLVMNNFNYRFNVNGQNWLQGKTSRPVDIQSAGNSTVTLPVTLNLLQMGQSVYQLLSGSQAVKYQFQGNMDLSSSNQLLKQVNLPFNKSGELKISR